MFKFAYAAAAATLIAVPTQAAVWTSYEAVGVTNTTVELEAFGVETFDSRTTGSNRSFTSTFGTAGSALGITGQYSNIDVRSANQYGGAGGSDRFAEADRAGYSLDLTSADGRDITFFGAWLSGVNSGNTLTFYKDGVQVYTYSSSNLAADLNNCATGYCGNPVARFEGRNDDQIYAFVNFHFTDGSSFDRVTFSNGSFIGRMETDNHTVGFLPQAQPANVEVGAVPEPATWAMLILGFGTVGAVMRRRNKLEVRNN